VIFEDSGVANSSAFRIGQCESSLATIIAPSISQGFFGATPCEKYVKMDHLPQAVLAKVVWKPPLLV